jgi:hypothetical protein
MVQTEWTSLILKKGKLVCFEDCDSPMTEIMLTFCIGRNVDSDNCIFLEKKKTEGRGQRPLR